MLKHWDIKPRVPDAQFDKFPNLPRLIVQILYNRGLSEPASVQPFLDCRGEVDDPFGLWGMAAAVERLSHAILHQEPIIVYGDYDADGVTSTALMMQTLTRLGARVRAYIPDRFDEGYGLNEEAIYKLANMGAELILTVDCGIRSVAEVTLANALGMDVIITDHHSVGSTPPPALSIINPKQVHCNYPFKELAGVGLSYRLTQALLTNDSLRERTNGFRAEHLLDLVAVGTVADLAPLHGENRMLVAQGLKQLNHKLRPGLAALMASVNRKVSEIDAGTIGFVIGPRLNAAGRLDSAVAAYKLLMARHELEAMSLAEQLDLQNRERQKLTTQAVEVSRQLITERGHAPLYFIHQPEFNRGVVGLAASRLTEEFYRPTLIAWQGPDQTVGSARSIAEFHITHALDECADLLERYGGHAAAAGFTVATPQVPALRERLLDIAGRSLNTDSLRPTLTIDAELNLKGVTPQLVEQIQALQPFGYGNPRPYFASRKLTVKQVRTVGQDGSHLRLVLFDGKQAWNGIAFRLGQWAEQLTPDMAVDVAYSLEFNEWNGSKTVQLNIKDLRISET